MGPPPDPGECILPTGYGFTVRDIQYSAPARSYTVVLQVAEQYLGDVVGYQSQVAELEAAGTAAQVDAQLRAAYQEGVEQNG